MLALLPLLVALVTSKPTYFAYIDKIPTWWPPTSIAAGIGDPNYSSDKQYNVLSLGFITTLGPADIGKLWGDPTAYFGTSSEFGSSKDAIQQKLMKDFHDGGVKLMISAFGSTQAPTTEGLDPTTTCNSLANFVKNNHLDGIDIDYTDNQAMDAGTGEAWLIKCTQAARDVLPKGKYYISHSPQAPYFAGAPTYKNGGYLKVHNEVGDLIDWYNVQYFNQGETRYDTYEELFISNTGAFAGTAVKQIMDNAGVTQEKLLIGKPVTVGDQANTGYVNPSSLGEMARRASSEIGWKAGLAMWQFESDTDGDFIKDYKNSLGDYEDEI